MVTLDFSKVNEVHRKMKAMLQTWEHVEELPKAKRFTVKYWDGEAKMLHIVKIDGERCLCRPASTSGYYVQKSLEEILRYKAKNEEAKRYLRSL